MKSCKSCGNQNIEVVFDAGQQPITSRYLKSRNEKEELYSLKLGQCLSCGLVQLMDLVPIQELQLIYEWISYNEPEGHLDDVVNQLSQLEGINTESSVLGISYKEDSTLARFNALGFSKIQRLPIPDTIAANVDAAGVEVVQNYISNEAFSNSGNDYHYDIILIRHILEHTYDSESFLQSLKKLAHKNSYLVFEVPDCSLLFSSCDYTAIWEDHTLYFTPSTFKAFLKNAGFSIVGYHLYPYPYENCLVIIASVDNGVSEANVSENLDASRKLMLNYGKNFAKNREIVREELQQIKKNFGDIAIFGAGHLATMYVNVFDVADLISFVVDDDQNKRGLFVPGCRLPIYSSSALLDRGIKYCLTSLSPESEQKVIAANKNFLSSGGIFASIFPSSPMSFINLYEN
jgi:hypothetical protein